MPAGRTTALFQRVAQERASDVFAVDVMDSSDQALFHTWKRQGVFDPFVPEEVAEKWPADQRNLDGMFAEALKQKYAAYFRI